MTPLEKQIIRKAADLGYIFLEAGDIYQIAKNYTNSKVLSIGQEIVNYFEG